MSKTETEKLVTDLKTIAHDAEKILISSAEAAGEKAHDVKTKIMSAFDTTKVSMKNIETQAIQAVKNTDSNIRKHPYQSIGIALGVGTVIGALAARHQMK